MGDNTKNHFNKKGFSGHKFFNEMWGKRIFFSKYHIFRRKHKLFFYKSTINHVFLITIFAPNIENWAIIRGHPNTSPPPIKLLLGYPPPLSTLPNGLGIKSIFALIIQHNYDKSFINCPTNVVLILIPGPPGAPHRLRTNKLNVIYKLNHLTES